MKKLNLNKYKKFIEGRVLYFATADKNGKPNLICVEGNKIIDHQILITNNCFNKTYKNLQRNNKVSLIVTNGKLFFQFKGIAKQYYNGKYYNLIKALSTNQKWRSRCAVLVVIREIYNLDNQKRLY